MISIGNLYTDGIDLKFKRYIVARKIDRYNGAFEEWLPELAPSESLLNLYLNLKNNGRWGKETFDKYYVPNFLYEMKKKEKRNALTKIFYEGMERDIVLLCHCKNEELCHRSILIGLLQGAEKENGIKIVDCKTDYSKYYTMFKK